MKCLCYSNRFYYKDLSAEDVDVIKNDLVLYNSMFHTAYKKVYLSCFHGADVYAGSTCITSTPL